MRTLSNGYFCSIESDTMLLLMKGISKTDDENMHHAATTSGSVTTSCTTRWCFLSAHCMPGTILGTVAHLFA